MLLRRTSEVGHRGVDVASQREEMSHSLMFSSMHMLRFIGLPTCTTQHVMLCGGLSILLIAVTRSVLKNTIQWGLPLEFNVSFSVTIPYLIVQQLLHHLLNKTLQPYCSIINPHKSNTSNIQHSTHYYKVFV